MLGREFLKTERKPVLFIAALPWWKEVKKRSGKLWRVGTRWNLR